MADPEMLAAAFEEHRPHLRGVAYRLLGSMTDADDAVQDAWLRLSRADATEVGNLGGWLTTVVARISLNMLRARRYRREEPVGDSWPGAAERARSPGAVAEAGGVAGIGGAAGVSGAAGPDPELEAVLADSVGLALLVVLDTLTPAERLAFVLHDLFAMPFAEVAAVLDRSPEATRQLASRARRRVRVTPSPAKAADLARKRAVAEAFLAASRGGDFTALIAVLDSEVILTADASAAPSGRPVTLRGAEAVARGAALAAGRAGVSQLVLVDGEVGIMFAPAGQLEVVLAMTISGNQISAIDVIADPHRLRHLDLALLPD
jgi:RNA polymerase sigma-70 factor, ECF subfamily